MTTETTDLHFEALARRFPEPGLSDYEWNSLARLADKLTDPEDESVSYPGDAVSYRTWAAVAKLLCLFAPVAASAEPRMTVGRTTELAVIAANWEQASNTREFRHAKAVAALLTEALGEVNHLRAEVARLTAAFPAAVEEAYDRGQSDCAGELLRVAEQARQRVRETRRG